MVKRNASIQEAFDRSPKRMQLIDLLSDSDSELQNLDFSRLTACFQSISPSGPRVRPALQEAPATDCSRVHKTNPAALGGTERANAEPTTPFQHSADQHDRRDDGLALARQGRESRVENEQQRSARCHKEVDDMDDVKLVESASDNMCNQLSENCPQRTVEQWRRLYDNIVLPAFQRNKVIASLAIQKPDRLSSKTSIRQLNQVVQSPRAKTHASTDIANRRHRSSSIVRTPELQNGTQPSAILPLSGARQSQRSHQQWAQTYFNIPPPTQAQGLNDLARQVQHIVFNVHQQVC